MPRAQDAQERLTYRIALGPHAGRKAFTLQTLPSAGDDERPAARANGFSLHAGVVAAADQRDKLERLRRYITRPAVSSERLSLATQGLIHYRLKTPYRDGTTHVVFEPLDFIARLASLVPTPRVNLTRPTMNHAVYRSYSLCGEADATATAIYAKACKQIPESCSFYECTRTMSTSRTMVTPDTTQVQSSDSELLRFLKGIKL